MRCRYSFCLPALEIDSRPCSSLSGFVIPSTAARSTICRSMWKQFISRFQRWKIFPGSSETVDFRASTVIYAGSFVGWGGGSELWPLGHCFIALDRIFSRMWHCPELYHLCSLMSEHSRWNESLFPGWGEKIKKKKKETTRRPEVEMLGLCTR